ncbi:MAG: glycosyltransferase family 4 protein [Lachnospiraceae bacterium]|nr:glycosyltransferase family 4 protein [Lachnospiraceae bacterium]
MKILILSHEYPPIGGGGANACYFLSREFAQAGHQVTIVTAQYEHLPQEEKTADGVLIFRVRCRRSNKEKSSFFEMFTYFTSAWIFTDRLLKKTSFDKCLVFFGIPSGPIALHLKNKYSLSYIIRFGGGDIPGAQKRFKYIYRILTPVVKKIWKRADGLIANSEGLWKRAQAFEDKYEITIVENGVDTDYFVPGSQNHDKKEIKILFVSRLIEGKGLQFIIPDMSKVRSEVWQKCGKKVVLVIVGDGPYRPRLEELVAKTQTGHCVKFEGHKNKEQVRQYYQDSDIFILPSLSEGMPNVVLEAMACGLPIVMTPCEGSKELVTDNGIVSELDSFADALTKVCVDTALRQTMGKSSLTKAETYFQWERISRRYLAFLEK